MIKTAAEIAKLAREFLKRQATKPATNVQGFMKGFYGGPVKKNCSYWKTSNCKPFKNSKTTNYP